MDKEYNKYKSKYLNMYMDNDDIEFVKEHLQYLTHSTSLENFESILKDGVLKRQKFDVVMMSALLKVLDFEIANKISADNILRNLNYNTMLEYPPKMSDIKDEMLCNSMAGDFNIGACSRPDYSPILLFDPKILWKELYYFFSRYDEYGESNTEMYISKGIKNKIIMPYTSDIIKKQMDKYDNVPTEKLKNMIYGLSFWSEIGFYTDIKIRKYLVGVVVPITYYDKVVKMLKKYKYDVDIFICDTDRNGITKIIKVGNIKNMDV
jgi:hypothetical protein